ITGSREAVPPDRRNSHDLADRSGGRHGVQHHDGGRMGGAVMGGVLCTLRRAGQRWGDDRQRDLADRRSLDGRWHRRWTHFAVTGSGVASAGAVAHGGSHAAGGERHERDLHTLSRSLLRPGHRGDHHGGAGLLCRRRSHVQSDCHRRGAFSAIVACLLVLPVSAYRSVDAKVADAVRLCGRAIADCLNCATDEQARKAHEAEYVVSCRLRDAYLVWRQAGMEKVPARFPSRRTARCTHDVLTHVQRLQENIALAERFSEHPLPAPLGERNKAQIEALATAIESHLNDVSDVMTRSDTTLDAQALWDLYGRFA